MDKARRQSQKPRQPVGIAGRKVFAHPEFCCAYLQNYPQNAVLTSTELKSKQVWKVSRLSGKLKNNI